MVAELRAPAMSSHGDGGGQQRDRSPRGRSRDSGRSLSSISSAGLRRSVSARRRRSTSVPAANSPSAHRPGLELTSGLWPPQDQHRKLRTLRNLQDRSTTTWEHHLCHHHKPSKFRPVQEFHTWQLRMVRDKPLLT